MVYSSSSSSTSGDEFVEEQQPLLVAPAAQQPVKLPWVLVWPNPDQPNQTSEEFLSGLRRHTTPRSQKSK